jgi:hypothetical protein
MLPGDTVIYKRYIGIVLHSYENKTSDVLLYNYRGFDKVIKQIDDYMLTVQVSLFSGMG